MTTNRKRDAARLAAAVRVTCDECGREFSALGFGPHRKVHRRAEQVASPLIPSKVSEAPDVVEDIVATGVDVSEAKAMVSGLTGEQENGNVRVAERTDFSEDDVVTMLRVVGAADETTERMIDLMDFMGKIRRGEA